VLIAGAPQRLLQGNLATFLDQIPRLRDGDESAIHDARVAIRRMREPLALVRAAFEDDNLNMFDARLRKVFKALGRARDADIAQRLVQHIETRFSLAPTAVGHLRATIARDQLKGRRRIIRALEATEATAFGDAFNAARQRERWRFCSRTPWREHVRAHIHNRGIELLRALEHAGGVYFRKRSHGARIAIKKFRYALELAGALGVTTAIHKAKSLRKAQSALGEAHDRDVLIARIEDLADADDLLPKQEATLLEQFLAGEIAEHHQKFITLRPAIVDTALAVRRPERAVPLGIGVSVVTAAAVTATRLMLQRRDP
jgi:CHAD domain-containing protein